LGYILGDFIARLVRSPWPRLVFFPKLALAAIGSERWHHELRVDCCEPTLIDFQQQIEKMKTLLFEHFSINFKIDF
jgi:hypothetical protein